VWAAALQVRDAFRRFRGCGPRRVDYAAAEDIPAALTEELEAAQQSKKVGDAGGRDRYQVVEPCPFMIVACGDCSRAPGGCGSGLLVWLLLECYLQQGTGALMMSVLHGRHGCGKTESCPSTFDD